MIDVEIQTRALTAASRPDVSAGTGDAALDPVPSTRLAATALTT
jgi:hypothetical protein